MFFLRAAGIFGVGWRPKPQEKTFHAGHYKDLTETRNRARKVSGTQGRVTDIATNLLTDKTPTTNISKEVLHPRIFVLSDK